MLIKVWEMSELLRSFNLKTQTTETVGITYYKSDGLDTQVIDMNPPGVSIATVLSSLGQQGWEPYAVTSVDRNTPEEQYTITIYYFKRQIIIEKIVHIELHIPDID